MDENPIKKIDKADFPETLRNIHRPPDFLYVRGSLPPAHYKYLCVIGSRLYSSYGKEVCEKLIRGLAGYPVSIVSGLAIGIDSLSHEAALGAGLHTISFPGSGLDWDVLYPATRRVLAGKILAAGGALLSKFEPNSPPAKWSFVERNVLMAGISHATLIIEGREGSGTLTTAEAALKFNRDVLVVPGSIFSELSVTPLKLMAEGAHPVTSSEDVLRALKLLPEKSDAKEDEADDPDTATGQIIFDTLSQEEGRILDRIRAPVQRDDLIRELDLPAGYVNSLLVNLELRGLVVERDGCLMVK